MSGTSFGQFGLGQIWVDTNPTQLDPFVRSSWDGLVLFFWLGTLVLLVLLTRPFSSSLFEVIVNDDASWNSTIALYHLIRLSHDWTLWTNAHLIFMFLSLAHSLLRINPSVIRVIFFSCRKFQLSTFMIICARRNIHDWYLQPWLLDTSKSQVDFFESFSYIAKSYGVKDQVNILTWWANDSNMSVNDSPSRVHVDPISIWTINFWILWIQPAFGGPNLHTL